MRFPSTLGIAAILMLAAAPASADDGIGKIEQGVPTANKKIGTPPNLIDPDFRANLLATGTDSLENPSGKIVKFGFLTDGTLTEADENTYLVFDKNPGGPDSIFDYGRKFLFQGHEIGGNLAYVTRINLQVPRGNAHRITLLTPVDPTTGLTGFNSIDGSTYDPFTKTLLFTEERSSSTRTGAGRVIQVTPNWPPQITTLKAFLGLGGYEGIHPDNKGNIYIIEDIGGTRNATTQAAQPNSFVYRFLPNDPSRLQKGANSRRSRYLSAASRWCSTRATPMATLCPPHN